MTLRRENNQHMWNFRAEGGRDLRFDLVLSAALGRFHGESRINFISKEKREMRRRRRNGVRQLYYPDKSARRRSATISSICLELRSDRIFLKIKEKYHQRFPWDLWGEGKKSPPASAVLSSVAADHDLFHA